MNTAQNPQDYTAMILATVNEIATLQSEIRRIDAQVEQLVRASFRRAQRSQTSPTLVGFKMIKTESPSPILQITAEVNETNAVSV